MRQKQVRVSSRKKLPWPLVEVSLTADGKRKWNKLSDNEILQIARQFVKDNNITSRWQIGKKFKGLYEVLYQRNLLDNLKLAKVYRNWASMSDEEIVDYAQKIVDKGINNRARLAEEDQNLYRILLKKKLIDRLKFIVTKKVGRNWVLMSDEQLIIYAQNFVKANKISDTSDFKKQDSGLHEIIRKRGLMKKIKIRKRKVRGLWSRYTNEELLEESQKFIDEKGINNRHGLEQKNLYITPIRNVYSHIEKKRCLS